jgi:Ca2+-binding EF-hand superfamily protein
MMLPKMLEDLLKQEENVEDLRAKFLEADVDQSGTLTIDELYSVLLKMGVDNINHDELRALMAEMDAD